MYDKGKLHSLYMENVVGNRGFSGETSAYTQVYLLDFVHYIIYIYIESFRDCSLKTEQTNLRGESNCK